MNVFDRLASIGVIPVVAIDTADKALDLADALAEGGLPVAEITYRTQAAQEAIAQIASKRADFLVGAGTVISEEQVQSAAKAGAEFALAPGTDATLIEAAKRANLPYAPGVATPSDLQIALRHGCRFLKFFPSEQLGGPAMLKSISAPFAHLDVGFNPTGGVNPDNMAQWLSMPNVRGIGGTWIATRQDIAEGNWARITQNARDAVACLRALREEKNV
ncbi:bifunctional 4-hydroxy-2-oxoglutarate aldolase/2-dehydro-3-deoxy-phosphogluconate aldolase [Polycladidibacter stylochi]|uniref:bifunctional 4-hydroxy-2-oxoglutarate aldolase/2-dehydro-3-deoxy-phosphogluconate aldolase n=1 Tax=Polycladidibacter stylochi TaxID=1807766 RepID=UPI000B1D641F|nr:bifunctional 4-hydroxy-2-oxoglutarate aldolase/2-dehydro-3-deoxy-phosphogluconate aldolase [Pseudovibrio stylochi]